MKWFFQRVRKRRGSSEIFPDEIFLDSQNLPQFDTHQFEGRLEHPISARSILVVGGVFCAIGVLFLSRAWVLQVSEGSTYAVQSEKNRLRHEPIIAERGAIVDRDGARLSWNVENPNEMAFPLRVYTSEKGFSHVLGYLRYPARDDSGVYYRDHTEGVDGVESAYNGILSGKNGLKIIETDALGTLVSEGILVRPEHGKTLTLSIDGSLQGAFYRAMSSVAESAPFQGGAGAVMDLRTGEMLAYVSYPEYSSEILTNGATENELLKYTGDEQTPFLNRVTRGLYAPGSIVKPFLSLAALAEGVIRPEDEIVSTGSIRIKNPFDPSLETVFNDWKAHGAVDMRRAIAVSSNVYFYEVGGGYELRVGLGIDRIHEYMSRFGFGTSVGRGFFSDEPGVVPSREWKQETFHDAWRLGDTYHTSIGQFGFQITPLQALLGVSTIARDGSILEPTIVRRNDPAPSRDITGIAKEYYQVVKDGMRDAVRFGTASGLVVPGLEVAAKTGTAEIGTVRKYVNSLVIGFFPFSRPRYAFVVVMEKGPRGNTVGATYVAREALSWIVANRPEMIVDHGQDDV